MMIKIIKVIGFLIVSLPMFSSSLFAADETELRDTDPSKIASTEMIVSELAESMANNLAPRIPAKRTAELKAIWKEIILKSLQPTVTEE